MRSQMRLLIVSACLASSLTSGAAIADDTFAKPSSSAAREHLSRGIRLYNTRSFEAAIQEFKDGAIVESTPVFDYNLGQCYRQLGKYEEALWHYERFLNHGSPTGPLLAAVTDFMREMRGHLANRALTMPPTGAAAEPDTSPGRPAATPAPTPPRQQPDAKPAEDRDSSINWVGWTVTGTGVVAMGAAGFLFVRASTLNDQANGDANARTRNELHNQADTRTIVGAVVGVGGAVLTATGIYMLLSHGRRHEASNATAFDVGISGRGVVVFGRF